MRQEGDEYFYKFPYQSDAAISSGYYYVAVISRGDNPATALDLGAGSSVYTLTSGPVSIVDERATVITADSPLSLPNQMLDYQEVAFYQFSVPDDALGVEVQMLNRVGQPRAAILSNEAGQSRMPNTPFTVEGGVTADATNDELVTVLGGGEFALAIEARGIETEATFDLEIKAVEAGLIEFDGGEVSDTLASAQRPSTALRCRPKSTVRPSSAGSSPRMSVADRFASTIVRVPCPTITRRKAVPPCPAPRARPWSLYHS